MSERGVVRKIQLIVHPGYYYAQEGKPKPHQALHLNHDLDNYGRIILEAAKNTDTLVILLNVTPNDFGIAKEKANGFNAIKALEKLQRFAAFAHKTLGDKLVTLSLIDFDDFSENPRPENVTVAKRKLSKITFDSVVSLQQSGQYTNLCVKEATSLLGEVLRQRKVKVLLERPRNSMRFTILSNLSKLSKKEFFREFNKLRRKSYGKRKPIVKTQRQKRQ